MSLAVRVSTVTGQATYPPKGATKPKGAAKKTAELEETQERLRDTGARREAAVHEAEALRGRVAELQAEVATRLQELTS